MTEELKIIDNTNIENMIYEIRGKQVMMDFDLAKLYHCKNGTKTINQAVNRHLDRFPNDFYFQLNYDEYNKMWSQLGTTLESNTQKYRKKDVLPYVFTEQGVAMLATILRTNVASQMSINIMRAFVKMRRFIKNNLLEQIYINNLVLEHDKDIKLLQETFNKLEEKEKINTIFFEGQIYDAYSLLLDILNKSEKEIVIIDNYAGKELLDILKNINKKIIIVSSNIDNTLKKKYEKQYSNITFINNNTFHDRFIITDQKQLYSCGSSFKDLGKKCFSINKIEDNEYINIILDKIYKQI